MAYVCSCCGKKIAFLDANFCLKKIIIGIVCGIIVGLLVGLD